MKTEEIKPKILDLIRKDSYSVTELCRVCGINRTTYYDWIANDPKFAADVKAAKDEFLNSILADAKVSLRKLVQGYTAEETTILSVPSKEKDEKGNPKPAIKEMKTTRKHIAPNTGAVIFALTNLESESWKNRQDFVGKVETKVEGLNVKDLPDDVLKRVAEELQNAME